MDLDEESITRDQLEILLGIIQPFQAWFDPRNSLWWIVPENGPPGIGKTYIGAVLKVADQWRSRTEGEDEP